MGKINKAGILGAGMMEAEIGLCFAMAGFEVFIKDQNVELVKGGEAAPERRIGQNDPEREISER